MQNPFEYVPPNINVSRKRKFEVTLDPSLQAIIKISNIHPQTLPGLVDELVSRSSKYGTVLEKHVPTVLLPFEASEVLYKGEVFLTLHTVASAKQAVMEFDNCPFHGSLLRAEVFKEPNIKEQQQKRRKIMESKFSKIYVSPLPSELISRSDEVKKLFMQFGKVSAVASPDPRREFVFVTFANPESAQKALEMDGSNYLGRKLTVRYADHQTVNDRTFTGQTKWIFINGLKSQSQEEIFHLFSEFGEIEEVDPTSLQKGTALIHYKHVDSVQHCLSQASENFIVQERKMDIVTDRHLLHRQHKASYRKQTVEKWE